MLTYEPDSAIAHRLDPRSKLAVQIGFAVAALACAGPGELVALTAVAGCCLWAARLSPYRALVAHRYALVVLATTPLASAVVLEFPWLDPARATPSAIASYRVLLILLVSAAFVRSTPVRESRAAIQRTVPGKPGQLLGVGVALVFRLLPLVLADIRTVREAIAARLGDERGPVDRGRRLGTRGLSGAFARADRLSLALQARCFSWNPTLPSLAFSRVDAPALALAGALAVSPVL